MTKAERAARKAWLDGLKEGDEVGVSIVDKETREARPTSWIEVVHARMSDGSIVVKRSRDDRECGRRFSGENGRIVDRKFHGAKMIVPVTDEIREAARAMNARSRLSRFGYGGSGWALVSDAIVLKVCELLDAELEAKKAAQS